MKRKANSFELAAVLFLLVLFFGGMSNPFAQTINRSRITTKSPSPTPAKKTADKLGIVIDQAGCTTASAGCDVVKNPAVPKPHATATPTQIPISDPRQPKIFSYVQSRVNGILANPMLRRGRVGVRIDWLDQNASIFSQNSDAYFMPASNMKSFSVATALDSLSPNFRFITSVYANTKPDTSGTIRGSLIVYGRGDPSFSTSFSEGDYYKELDDLAEKIVQAGVKKIEGGILGDETYFNTEPIPSGWEWDDLQWYYGAEVSSLTINDNTVDLKIFPAAEATPCGVSVSPYNTQFRIINKCQTVPAGTPRKIGVKKKLNENFVEITGTMPVGDTGYSGAITVSRPAKLFVELLTQRLQLKGVAVAGGSRVINRYERAGTPLQTETLVELARHESPPLSLIAQKTMKPSQNLYTELILRVLGEERGDKTDKEKTSEQKGIEIVQDLLRKAGAEPESVVQYDGSGLSRHNLITPDSAVKLFSYMSKSANSSVWRDSLTIGGVDGTLKRRFIGTSAQSNVRGKTGTIDQVSALSGYVTAKSGEQFVFSILTNNLPNSRLRTSVIDDIVVALSEFDSRDVEKAAN